MRKFFGRLNNIFFKVFGAVSGLTVFFALLLGIVFIRLYTTASQRSRQEQLCHVSEQLAARIGDTLKFGYHDEIMQFLQIYNSFESAELWFVNNGTNIDVDDVLPGISMELPTDQEEFLEVIDKTYEGKQYASIFYSDVHMATAIVVGTPVMSAEDKPVGVLVSIETLEDFDDAIRGIGRMIFISAVMALLVSGLIAFMFARRITEPIRRMRLMTRDMMDGNYKLKTGIKRTDEIGEMARSIDMLSDKLLENEKERKNMEQMRIEFFANVSHELRTPITVVRAYAESLVDGVVTTKEAQEDYYSRILRECTNMERLVGDLLTLSKMQNPNFHIEKELVSLTQILEDAVGGVGAIAAEKGISISPSGQFDEPCMVMGDYGRLRQMFMVVFDNALKFSPEGSTIHVNVKCAGGIEVSIRDEGVGIAPEELPNIFEKFYKSRLLENEKGSGLGLAIAKYICEKHNGTVRVESEVGKGTVFTFVFGKV
ncbi:MAG: HAMP domain-containing histidine kinase [Lachnospiraceae bacterium]|nr:HAMP domain-containing histidine kinase [Lachnospiraceae bacterium]